MPRSERKVGLTLILVAVVIASGPVWGRESAASLRRVTNAIAQVQTGKTPTLQDAAAEKVFDLTHNADFGDQNRAVIDRLVLLMSAPDAPGRYWVARAIGNFGAKATFAVPALEKALAGMDCVQGSKTSASGIRFALAEIGVTPPDRKCDADRP